MPIALPITGEAKPEGGFGSTFMDKKGESVKLAFLLPTSRIYLSSDGLVRSLGDRKRQEKENFAEQVEVMEKRVARLQSIHDRLEAIISELEEYLRKK